MARACSCKPKRSIAPTRSGLMWMRRCHAYETATTPAEAVPWALWARQEADRIDPVANGAVGEAISQHVSAAVSHVP